jgi:hypothetical protein
MEIQELIVGPIYFIIIMIIANLIKKSVGDEEMQRYFIRGLFLKLIGAIGIYYLYFHYYGGGDTRTYFNKSKYLTHLFYTDFNTAYSLFFESKEDYGFFAAELYNSLSADDVSTFIICKFGAILNFVCFDSYLGIAFLFCVFAYFGIWKMFKTFTIIYPKHVKILAYSFLFIPSVFFWGSGLLKDTIALGFLGLIVSSLHAAFIERKSIYINILYLVVSIYIIGIVKSYILMALLPALSMWTFLIYRKNIKSDIIKTLSTPIFIVLILVSVVFVLQGLGNIFTKFSVDNAQKKAEDMQRWHTYVVEVMNDGEGSSYNLGEIDFSPVGLMRTAPAAINVALFRPWLWEVKNPVMLLEAMESLFILVFSIYTLFIFIRNIPIGLSVISDNPSIMFMIVFAIIFAFSVGFTSYNFGSLSRYRIPLLPFYVGAILILRAEISARTRN